MEVSRIWGKNMGISVNLKAELRKQMLARRRQLLPERKKQLDEALLWQFKQLSCLHRVSAVYVYSSVRGEAGTEPIIHWLRGQGIRTAFPRVEQTDLRFYFCDSIEELQTGSFGILEPKPACEPAFDYKAPVLVPGVVFSEALHRIGYGAGFYDRFLTREPLHRKIGLCYEFQVVPEFAAEPSDVPMDCLLTETGRFGGCPEQEP